MKIRTRLITVFVAFTFAAVLGIVYLIAEEIRPSYLEAQEEALVDFSEMFAAVVSENAITTSKSGGHRRWQRTNHCCRSHPSRHASTSKTR